MLSVRRGSRVASQEEPRTKDQGPRTKDQGPRTKDLPGRVAERRATEDKSSCVKAEFTRGGQPAGEMICWHSLSIGVGVGIGIGIDLCCVLRRILMNSIASLSEFHQHRHDAVGQDILSIPIPIPTPTPSYILASLPDKSGTAAGGSGMSFVLRPSSVIHGPRTKGHGPMTKGVECKS